jgi:3'-5' exoribonuclease
MNTSEFSANERFDRMFLLKSIDERLTKNGKPYIALVLGSPAADLDARVWDMDMKSLPGLVEGDPVRASGKAQLYQDNLQLVVDVIEKVESSVDPREIYPSSAKSEGELRQQFSAHVEAMVKRDLIHLMAVMQDDEDVFDAFFISPAAITMHHARIGGLAEHSLNVCRIALAVSDIFPWLDRDLLTVGALLHDIGKVLEYKVAGDFRYTRDGKLIGHVVRGHSITEGWIRRVPEFPEQLEHEVLHIILSHHGQLEHGSPKMPATAEALVIHYADDLDAKLDMVRTASPDNDTLEAFVRGLRRTFQFRVENEGAGRGAQGEAKQGRVRSAEDQERGEILSNESGEDDDQGKLF